LSVSRSGLGFGGDGDVGVPVDSVGDVEVAYR
jgi:hypothetical protein